MLCSCILGLAPHLRIEGCSKDCSEVSTVLQIFLLDQLLKSISCHYLFFIFFFSKKRGASVPCLSIHIRIIIKTFCMGFIGWRRTRKLRIYQMSSASAMYSFWDTNDWFAWQCWVPLQIRFLWLHYALPYADAMVDVARELSLQGVCLCLCGRAELVGQYFFWLPGLLKPIDLVGAFQNTLDK